MPENPILPKLGILLPSISPVFAVFPGLIERGPHPIEHVFNTFWENTHAVELDDGSGFEMITYDDDDNEESTVISHDAMWQITSGLEPLVGSCAGMMMELMGVGMPPHDHEDDWGEEELNHF